MGSWRYSYLASDTNSGCKVFLNLQGNVHSNRINKSRVIISAKRVTAGHLDYAKNYLKDYTKNDSTNRHIDTIF